MKLIQRSLQRAVLAVVSLLACQLVAGTLGNPDTEGSLREEWAIQLTPGSDPLQFAQQHELFYAGQIPNGDMPIFVFKLAVGPSAAAKRSVEGKSEAQRTFLDLLAANEHKAKGAFFKAASELTDKVSKREIDESETEPGRMVWFEQQTARRRDKRELQLPSDPLFLDQWHLIPGVSSHVSVNIYGAWSRGFFGNGVTIAICDDGFDLDHPDISGNYVADGSYNFNKDNSNVRPNSLSLDYHGTAAGGVAAARDDGSKCGVGAAFRSGLSAVVILQFADITDSMEARALNYKPEINQIYSNSWGPEDDGLRKEGPRSLTVAAMDNAIKNGRGGKGSIFVWAAGNGRPQGDNCNYDGYANSRKTITIGAVDYSGNQAWYSEPCAALMAVTPSSGLGAPNGLGFIVTTDLMGTSGADRGDCNKGFSGTSSACPLGAGLIALALEANPSLNWLEVQQVLMDSTKKVSPSDADWVLNGAGRWVNHKYGYGLLDADLVVQNAHNFSQRILPEQTGVSVRLESETTFEARTGISTSVEVPYNCTVQHVELMLKLQFSSSIGKLTVVLVSPVGTRSVLAETHRDPQTSYNDWTFGSLRHWGEPCSGTWSLLITSSDPNASAGTLNHWELRLFSSGRNYVPITVPRDTTPPISPPTNLTTPDTSEPVSPGTVAIVSVLVAVGVLVCLAALGATIYFRYKRSQEVPYLPAKTEFEDGADEELKAGYEDEIQIEDTTELDIPSSYPQITLQDENSEPPSPLVSHT